MEVKPSILHITELLLLDRHFWPLHNPCHQHHYEVELRCGEPGNQPLPKLHDSGNVLLSIMPSEAMVLPVLSNAQKPETSARFSRE